MPFTVKMPKLSPTMEEGVIAKWHKKEGDLIKSGEVLLEAATDKATVEYEALDDGYLRKILVQDGDSAKVNQPIAIFTESKDESIEGYTPEGESPKEETKKPQEIKKEETVAPSETNVSSPTPKFVPEKPLDYYEFSRDRSELQERLLASPLARKIAKDKGLDLTSIKGSGPGGRIMSRDLEHAVSDTMVAFGRREVPQELPGSFEEIPLSHMRKVIGQRLGESKRFIPHFYVQQEVEASGLIEIREQLKRFRISLTFNDFIVRACALALRDHPELNRGFNSETQSIIQFKTIDISIAVTIPEGLITPILRHADYKELGEISVEAKALAQKAKEQKLEPHEYKGGSFTISNLGMFGISNFSAIINPPQAAILAVGGISEKPIVKNGIVVPGKMIGMTLACDHRIIDGADAAKFIKTVQKLLENPSTLVV